MAEQVLTTRWTQLTPHERQLQLWLSDKRFRVVPAGRRSGKTELAKRHLVKKAVEFTAFPDGRFIFGAPTRTQAKEIFWEDVKALVPKWALLHENNLRASSSESEMTVWLWNNAKIQVIGMDVPERAEGSPLDGIVLDEYGNMKAHAWTKHIRPALSTPGRPGWAWFIGVPEGRNHYYQLYLDCDKVDNLDTWESFLWPTADINPSEAEAAKRDMDILTWRQEYEGAFISFEGRCYYAFNSEIHTPPIGTRVLYEPELPLIFCFDFNRRPGVTAILQEQLSPEWLLPINRGVSFPKITCAIGEVFILNNSNTEVVCDELIAQWANIHKGDIYVYGDASGGAETAQGVRGSDWDLVENKLKPVFGQRLKMRYKKKNPYIRARINSVNSRLASADGYVHAVFDAQACPNLIRDLEGVACDEHSGEPLKEQGSLLSHISDAYGYYMDCVHPCGGQPVSSSRAA
jgi:hypothetical protein